MKKNKFIENHKRHFIAFLLVFCGLLGQKAMAQALEGTFTWKAAPVDNNWTNPANWTKTGTTAGLGAADTYPGETPTRAVDVAIVATGAAVSIPARVDAYSLYRLDIYNSVAVPAGSVVTVDNGATLNLGNNNANQLRLAGGTLINNGAVNISTTSAGFSNAGPPVTNFPATGIICLTPVGFPTVETEYGYRGTGTLSISLPNANFANSALFYSNASSTNTNIGNVIYKFVLNNPTLSYNQGTALTIGAIRTIGVSSTTFAPKLLFSGTGFTMGTPSAPYIGSLIGQGGGTSVTFDTGTTVTFNSRSTNATAIIGSFSSVGKPTNVTNNGTLNIVGASTRSGFNYSVGSTGAGGGSATFNITNNGTLNVNMNVSAANSAAFSNSDGGGRNGGNSLNLVNSVTGIMNLTNSGGSAIVVSQSFNAPPLVLTNRGTLNLNGISPSGGATYTTNPDIKGYLNNHGLLNTNHELRNMVFTNNSSATIAFVNPALAATTTALVNGGTFTTNDGRIQTGSDKLNDLSLIGAYSATSSIEPGGNAKGIADFKQAATIVQGKLVIQVAGNTTAGTDFDQVKNTSGNIDVTAATLDITGITGTATPVDIVLATGTITGPFGSVIGLTTGWSVDYSTVGKVQLVYAAVSPTANSWTGATNSDWATLTNWSAGVPDQNSDVTIPTASANQPIIGSNVNINSLVIESGKTVTVNTGFNLTIKDAITNNGSLTMANNANLIQVNDVANTGGGTTTVNRNGNALFRQDYTLWSSPVSGQNLLAFSPLTSVSPTIRFLTYTETSNTYSVVPVPSTTAFTTATGYLIRMPNTGTLNYEAGTETLTFPGQFTGTPNNGTIPKAVTYLDATHGYNALGNPYPSTLDASAFITANTANIESSLYFWRKRNAASGSAYAIYNPLGGTTASPTSALPNGTIQVGQGFFVKAKSASSVNFTNAMRVANNGNQFFRTKAVQKDRLWLNLTNTAGVFSQALIGYTADATLGEDMYDAKYINDSPIALTSAINNEEYSIQGRPAFDPTDVVALNFKTDLAGTYTITLDQFDGAFATGQEVYLLDNNTGAETDLKAGSYTFTAATGTDNTRFSLKYQKTLKVEAPGFNASSVRVYKNNGMLYVNSGEVAMIKISVYDVQGRLIAEQNNVKATTATIKDVKSNQVMIVKILGENNVEISKKVLN